jgi:glycosyltransferase A (GT-A) superfamily protein (DUF2064 family)
MSNETSAEDARRAEVALIVIAKEPIAGRVKTRLCPPCTPEQAADLAAAALHDTLTAVAETPAARRVVALDGRPGPWLPEGFDVIAQADGGLDERLAHAFSTVGGPALLIGMDTPQVTPTLLGDAARELVRWPNGSVLGLAPDGGWWAIGLRRADPRAFLGVPMSTAETGARQHDRLCARGSIPTLLPELRDVDTYADAHLVASDIPRSRFAGELDRIVDEIDGPAESEDAA